MAVIGGDIKQNVPPVDTRYSDRDYIGPRYRRNSGQSERVSLVLNKNEQDKPAREVDRMVFLFFV